MRCGSCGFRRGVRRRREVVARTRRGLPCASASRSAAPRSRANSSTHRSSWATLGGPGPRRPYTTAARELVAAGLPRRVRVRHRQCMARSPRHGGHGSFLRGRPRPRPPRPWLRSSGSSDGSDRHLLHRMDGKPWSSQRPSPDAPSLRFRQASLTGRSDRRVPRMCTEVYPGKAKSSRRCHQAKHRPKPRKTRANALPRMASRKGRATATMITRVSRRNAHETPQLLTAAVYREAGKRRSRQKPHRPQRRRGRRPRCRAR
mmetsp:Transcript_64504/g.185402  ORF Transcript_64504/g.185402 Transcript_64504/m.185402 type:complete len:260 (+) Transcript_64504:170-949(+)